ncbi:MAG TPA: PQQ-binding-like beta-propeller repeat protein [Parachlamydiaceae bacterium]|nr:PQQ-binding-like beta-propeller repeat protein [Parachlamydiaceae bacterium]
MFRNLNIATSMATFALLCMSSAYASDWSSVNYDYKNSRHNVDETILAPDNVDELTLLWASDPLPGLVNVTPIVVNDVIYFGDSAGNLYAKSLNDGSDVYPSVNLGASIDGPVTVFENTLYATSAELKLYAFNLDLTPKTAFNGGSVVIDPASVGIAQVYAGPVVVENIVIIPTTSGGGEIYFNLFPTFHGSITAFSATTGAFLWRTPIVEVNEGAGGGAWSQLQWIQNLSRSISAQQTPFLLQLEI